ncbi:MAG: PQQ-binding-like beta-propeller repeat protein [Pirellulaceae bacterium]|jgi:outer membrane protein assembly factor BamB|nr:PQQ-binding-like beta-propeller repeat protein [Pirellulaceae bacterium]
MRVEQFIDRLEQRGLLDKDVISELRRKIAQTKSKKITPEAIAKYLVDRGHLTRFQATKLVSDFSALPEAAGEPRAPWAPDELRLTGPDDDLTRLCDTVDASRPGAAGAAAPADDEEVLRLTAIDDEPSGRVAPAARPGTRDEPYRAAERPPEPARAASPPPPQAPPAPPVAPRPPAPSRRGAAVLDDTLLGLESAAALGDAGNRGAWGPTPRGLQKTSEWDSMLLLVGGASLGVLLVIGAFLYLSLTRGAAEDLLGAAEGAYQDQSYTLAIRRYDEFLESYPRHEKSSLARVRRELARLRQVYKTPEQGLKVALAVLPQIETEESFAEARDELASMLPQIARGFVDQARVANDTSVQEALLAKTEAAMTLVNNATFIPTTLRKSQLVTIDGIVEDMARVRRDIDRVHRLAATIATITQAVEAGDTQTAYQARETLLQQYPGLDTDEQLRAAVLKISEKERERVTTTQETLTPVAEEPAAATVPSIVLAHRTGRALADVAGHVVYTLAGGSVFALDAASGEVLWRRFVGFETTTPPQPLSATTPGADAIVADQRRQELLRLEARSGRVLWRLTLGEPFREPVIVGERIYVARRSGVVCDIDAATGYSHRQVRIPQPVDSAIGTGVGRPRLYQVAEQDNLYVLSADTLACDEVFYLGHRRGTITVAPVMALGYLFIVENAGPDFSYLHILQTDDQGRGLKTAQPKVRLRGQVLVPPIVSRRRVMVVTDRRAVELYDVDPLNDSGTPITSAGRLNATADAPMVSYALLDGGFMWVANNRLTKYQVQASTGKLPTEWVQDEQDVYVAPLQLIRDVVIHVRQRQASPGLTVAALRVNEQEPAWQTEVAVPAIGLFVEGQRVDLVTARGRLYRAESADLERRVLSEAQASAVRDERLMLSLAATCDLGNGQRVLSPRDGYTQLVVYQPAQAEQPLRLLTLAVPAGEATTEPVAFGGGLLVPLRSGSVRLVDPVSGADQARPFLPSVPTGTATTWNLPAAYTAATGQPEFAIANNHRALYGVGIKDTPARQLAEVKQAVLDGDLTGPLAVAGGTCYGVLRTGAEDTLVGFTLATAAVAHRSPLAGRLAWGPARVGQDVWLATEQELLCWDGTGQPRWRLALEHGPPTGTALEGDSRVWLAAAEGHVLQIDPAQGAVLAVVSLGEPLASGPVALGDRLLVAGLSGTVLIAGLTGP